MKSKDHWESDKCRKGTLPSYQYFYRKAQAPPHSVAKFFYKLLLMITRRMYCVEIAAMTQIGKGLYINHPYGITINPNAILGDNINISKGVTIGRENRGKRQGTPIIGNRVWIGVNATVVGKVIIGDDVLIAPNTFVNCDVPSHSIVFGNPCIIKQKENATAGYIDNIV